MAFSAELVRPDDLVHLRVTGPNLVLDPTDPDQPVVVVDDPAQPAFLTVEFPAQSISEAAYFEWDVVKPEDKRSDGTPFPPRPNDPPQPAGKAHEPLDLPGRPGGGRRAAAQMSHPSRLVFKVPVDARIPFSLAGLLDWSTLELSVSPVAAIGPDPTSAQIAKAPPVALRRPQRPRSSCPTGW